MQKPITIKEIAKALNVSPSTVSRALNNHESIGFKTRTRIQEFAKAHNYMPNQAAIHFKTGKNFTIGVIVPSLTESYFSKALTGIEDEAKKHGYNVLISQSHDDLNKEKEVTEFIKRTRVDGLLVSISKSTISIRHFEELIQSGIPVVFFDRIPKGKEYHAVSSDLFNSSKILVEYLWDNGHKNIALIKGPSTLPASKERMRGFMEGLDKKRIKTDSSLFATTDLTQESTWAAMEEILSQKNKPTAVVAFNDYVALDAIKYIKEKTNLVVNKDIVFVSFANVYFTSYMAVGDKPIASIEQFPYRQGNEAAKKLFDLIQNPDNEACEGERHLVIQGEIMLNP